MTSTDQAGKWFLFGLLRFGFRLVPMSADARDRMRVRFLDRYSHLVPTIPLAQPPPTIRRGRLRSDEPAIGYVPYRKKPLPSPLPATLIAFYLPKVHAGSDNDAWGGEERHEWLHVARALPQFEGHAQPRLPADLGFYDLSNPATMRAQAKLAKEYGIGAFCFFFDWPPGRPLLETPLRQWLDDAALDLPICLCWFNEDWSRSSEGRSADLLLAPEHSIQDDEDFIAHVAVYFRDPRYLRVDDKPLLLVYRPDLLPNPGQTVERWRLWCRANRIGEIHVAYVQGFEQKDPRDIGFDAAVELPPNLSTARDLTADQRLLNPEFEGQVLDWRDLAADYSSRAMPPYTLYPGVNAGWDDEPRLPGKGRVYLHAAPRRYRDWLQSTINLRLAGKATADRLVFISAWNEWARGSVLEPDTRLGYAWLDATRSALQQAAAHPSATESPVDPPCAVIHAWYPDVLDEILGTLRASGLSWRLVVTTTAEKVEAVRQVILERGMQAEIEVFPNRGRDILPFLRVANRLLDEGVRVVLKLHTKRSVHRVDGDDWRRDIITRLASRERAARILHAFETDMRLGLVGPEGHLLPMEGFWGENMDAMNYLGTRLGMPVPHDHEYFVAGSMFWARLEALRPLLDASLNDADFEPESGQLDGTLAHAVERVMGSWAVHAGFHVKEAGDITGDSSPGSALDYHSAPERV